MSVLIIHSTRIIRIMLQNKIVSFLDNTILYGIRCSERLHRYTHARNVLMKFVELSAGVCTDFSSAGTCAWRSVRYLCQSATISTFDRMRYRVMPIIRPCRIKKPLLAIAAPLLPFSLFFTFLRIYVGRSNKFKPIRRLRSRIEYLNNFYVLYNIFLSNIRNIFM